MNDREQKRLLILNEVLRGRLNAEKAARLLQRSVRQVRRLLARYRDEGAKALVHGNRGRHPGHMIKQSMVNRIVDLAKTLYAGFNQQHLTEMLAERHRIHVSRSSVRRILECAGIPSPRRRRPPKHRSRRERYPQEGMLVQIDGSPHAWLGPGQPKWTLLAAVDDATGKLLNLVFRHQEDAQGYVLLLRGIVDKFGCPLAVYRDRHGIFERSGQKPLTILDQLHNVPNITQFARVLRELNIQSIPAFSPQGKGRVERSFGTLQDRLVNELRLSGAQNMQQAQSYLPTFIERYNRSFAVTPAQSGTVYRRIPNNQDPETIFCFKYQRTVGPDNVVRFAPHRIQLQADSHRLSYARARVEVHEQMDGSIAIYYRQRRLMTQPAPAEAPILRIRHTRALPLPDAASTPAAEPSKRPAKTPLQKVAGRIRGHHPKKPDATHPWRRKTSITDDLNRLMRTEL